MDVDGREMNYRAVTGAFENEFTLEFSAVSENEAFARTVVASFITGLNPIVSEIMEIKTAVSEAVTNAIIHGYDNRNNGVVTLYCKIKGREVYIRVSDEGVGITDVVQAMEPLYTSKPELERSGMGFTVMETFMDVITVESEPGVGTTVTMTKKLV